MNKKIITIIILGIFLLTSVTSLPALGIINIDIHKNPLSLSQQKFTKDEVYYENPITIDFNNNDQQIVSDDNTLSSFKTKVGQSPADQGNTEGLPDLVISNCHCWWADSRVSYNWRGIKSISNWLCFSYKIQNIGADIQSEKPIMINLSVMIDDDPHPFDLWYIVTNWPNNAAIYHRRELNADYFLTLKPKEMTIMVDADDNLMESNENNNNVIIPCTNDIVIQGNVATIDFSGEEIPVENASICFSTEDWPIDYYEKTNKTGCCNIYVYPSDTPRIYDILVKKPGFLPQIKNSDPVYKENDLVVIDFILELGYNGPPYKPDIPFGPTRLKVGETGTYTTSAIDPDGDDIYLYVDWGDDTSEGWIGPFSSGEEITISHAWSEQGDYIIRARAKDIYDGRGDWVTLPVTMPKNRLVNRLFQTSLQIHANMFPILRKILGI